MSGFCDLDARKKADVSEPRRSAEGRRFDKRRDHTAARLRTAASRVAREASQLGVEGRVVEGDRSVRFEEEQEDVGPVDTRQIESSRGLGGSVTLRVQACATSLICRP